MPYLIAAACLFALLVWVFVIPVLRDEHARRHRMDAAEKQQIDAFFEPLKRDRDDYLASLDLGFTEDPEAFAARLRIRDQARRTSAFLAELTEADAAAGHLDRTVPAARKETP
jgi:hypothetical protein